MSDISLPAKAAEKKRAGSHNCAQAVVTTYADMVGLDEATANNIAAAFGTGMGNAEGTCGALVGAGIILGLAKNDRIEARRSMNTIMTKFRMRNGATQCRLLKGVDTKVVLRDCAGCVQDAAELLQEELSRK